MKVTKEVYAMITCPVCRNKCSDNATECDRCGFKELQVTFINEDEANYWAEHTLKPYVVQWENKIRNTSEPEPDGDQDDLDGCAYRADGAIFPNEDEISIPESESPAPGRFRLFHRSGRLCATAPPCHRGGGPVRKPGSCRTEPECRPHLRNRPV